jgi:streptogramin lyase
MFDTKTLKFTEWTMPTEWTRPYDAQYDDRAYAWTAGMDNDRAVRLNVATGEFTEYLLPGHTNVRHVEVQKSGALSSLWLGGSARQHADLHRWKATGADSVVRLYDCRCVGRALPGDRQETRPVRMEEVPRRARLRSWTRWSGCAKFPR